MWARVEGGLSPPPASSVSRFVRCSWDWRCASRLSGSATAPSGSPTPLRTPRRATMADQAAAADGTKREAGAGGTAAFAAGF